MRYINEIASIVCFICMVITAFCENIPFTIMNGFLMLGSILLVIAKKKDKK
jgi:hypothetical protein